MSLATLASAQETPARLDTASLFTLQTYARIHDPRLRQVELLKSQSDLRDATIRTDRLPIFQLETQAQYQSAVAEFPGTLPGGARIPRPSHDTYDARLNAQVKVYDGTVTPRRAVEEAQLAESRARVVTSVYAILQQVNDAFFAVLRAEAQAADVETTITNLEAQIRLSATRVREGTALPSEENILRAEVLRRRQNIAELTASKRAALAVLADLTGQSLDSTAHFTAPDLSLDVARAREALSTQRARPEFAQFQATREVIAKQRDLRIAQDRPRVSVYGKYGYGRPGLNPLNTGFTTYWLGGIQSQWTPWNWNTTHRDREVLELQRRINETEEQAFAQALQRATRQDLETIDRVEKQLADDDKIIALRESIAAEANARFTESVITSAELVDRQTDVLSARLTRSVHRVELAQARARLLTTLGIETR